MQVQWLSAVHAIAAHLRIT